MKRLTALTAIVLCASLGFIAASCGGDEGAVGVGPAPSVEETNPSGDSGTGTSEAEPTTGTDAAEGGSETNEPEPSGNVTYEVWFHRSEAVNGRAVPTLFVVHRTQPATRAVGAAAVEALLAGPDGDREMSGDVETAIPRGTRLLGLDIDGGIATVDLTSEFESGGGSLSMQMRLAQVVYTLTQFPTVKSVLFRLDGEPVDVFSGEGIVLDKPVTRRDYGDLLPTILVEKPAVWDEVHSPVTISGSANVFEANVTVRILLDDGTGKPREIARTFTTATCGTGCRGDFSVSVPYEVTGKKQGVIVVHDDDAAGTGRPPHEVRIPVILSP
jgi:hypothetical protein